LPRRIDCIGSGEAVFVFLQQFLIKYPSEMRIEISGSLFMLVNAGKYPEKQNGIYLLVKAKYKKYWLF